MTVLLKITDLLRSALKLRKEVYLRVDGESMEPVIRSGEKVLLRQVLPAEISIGDVVIHGQTASQIICHRVLGIIIHHSIQSTYRVFIIMGDRSRYPILVQEEDVIGKVVSVKRRGKAVEITKPLIRTTRFKKNDFEVIL